MNYHPWRPTALLLIALLIPSTARTQEAASKPPRRNIIIFVADGLRHGSVNEADSPTLWSIRTNGVHFENSHSLFPTFTTANASAIATGHGLGDTGDFSNDIWVGYPLYDTGNFGFGLGTPTPFIENDQVLADLDDHFHGNYLGEETLLSLARAHGYNTAAIGKLGPAAIQDAPAIAPANSRFPFPPTSILVDDSTGVMDSGGKPIGPALPEELLARLTKEKLSREAPGRTNGYAANSPYNNGNSGDSKNPGTIWPNLVQQQWFADVATNAVLPLFESDSGKPFAIVFWSRDPDGTQHNQGDSLGTLLPGINGDSSRAAVRNADNDLKQLLDWLAAHPAIQANTDVFVTSDHGFATISRREIDRTGHPTQSEAAKHYYVDANGKVDTNKGFLPSGFLAIDLAVGLQTNLFDPDRHAPDGSRLPYRQIHLDFDTWEHPAGGNGLIGTEVLKLDGSDAMAIVAANGGSDLVYVPDGNAETVGRIVKLLLSFDYVGGIFVDDKFQPVAGTLPLSTIGLKGSSAMPRPAIAVAFKTFYLNPGDLQRAALVSDTGLQEGQGMHGGFGRECTYNNMAAIGPDFKAGFIDRAPASNEDIVPTLARVMGIELHPRGSLRGRVLEEALAAGKDAPAVKSQQTASPSANGLQTVLVFQELDGERYMDTACMIVAGEAGAVPTCPQ